MGLNDEQREWLRLTMVPGVGTAHFVRLLARFHTPGRVLEAGRSELEEVVGRSLAERIVEYRAAVDLADQERRMAACDTHLTTLEDPAYPIRLAEIYDPPLALFVRGDVLESDTPCVSIVGTRRASPYGIRMAEKFGRELAEHGVIVVSGMAMGIDAAAHRGSIDAGGRTIAVLGCGVDVVYPPQHESLMAEIVRHGSVISQFEMGVKPSKGHFPYRNRIISGMTLGTLVVEAPTDSGALITARQAVEQGREVFAVPGQIGCKNSEGPHALIREGARLVETVEDILVELELPVSCRRPAAPAVRPPEPSPVSTSQPDAGRRETPAQPPGRPGPASPARANVPAPSMTPKEKDVLSVLSPDGSFVDEIAMACRIPVSEALSSLTLLELKGLVRQFSGKRFAPR